MLKLENMADLKNERLRILRAILLQPITYYKLDSNKRLLPENFNKGIYNTTKDIVFSDVINTLVKLIKLALLNKL